MADLNRVDLLWKIIQRYDTYIGTTNAKAAFMIAWNTFIFGVVATKAAEFITLFQSWNWMKIPSLLLMVILVVAALVSVCFTFCVVNPFLKSPKVVMEYHSAIFFGHVSQHESETKYHDTIIKLNDEAVIKDLSYQTHVLAQALHNKFQNLKRAVAIILFVQIPTVLFLILAASIIKFL